jgi:GH24 family phage-related lysozyme (muramidase)
MTFVKARNRAISLIKVHEDVTAHMYLDSLSHVTIGYGHMIASAADTLQINMRRYDNRAAATSDEKRNEWNRLRKLSQARVPRNFSAKSYEKNATIYITQLEADTLLDADLAKFINLLRANYPKFDTFPEDAQVAMIDMAYNLGNKIHSQFKTFTAAINNPKGPNWELAAKNSNRYQLSPDRNNEVYNLFMAAHYWEAAVKPALSVATAAARAGAAAARAGAAGGGIGARAGARVGAAAARAITRAGVKR